MLGRRPSNLISCELHSVVNGSFRKAYIRVHTVYCVRLSKCDLGALLCSSSVNLESHMCTQPGEKPFKFDIHYLVNFLFLEMSI